MTERATLPTKADYERWAYEDGYRRGHEGGKRPGVPAMHAPFADAWKRGWQEGNDARATD